MKALLKDQGFLLLETASSAALRLTLLSAIMAPSLKTASSTMRMVGKYLRGDDRRGQGQQQHIRLVILHLHGKILCMMHTCCCTWHTAAWYPTAALLSSWALPIIWQAVHAPVVRHCENAEREADAEGHGHGVLGVGGHALEDHARTNHGLNNHRQARLRLQAGRAG
jgi:hypothetical protein